MIQAHPSGLLCLVKKKKKTFHAQKVWEEEWEMLDRESIHSFVASPLRRTSLSGLRRIFPSLSAGSPSMLWRWVSLNLSMGQHRPSPKPECFKQPSGRAGRMGLARNTAREPGESALLPALIGLSVWKRSTRNRKGGTNQTNLLPHGRKGQSMTKGVLLWGGVQWSITPHPNLQTGPVWLRQH